MNLAEMELLSDQIRAFLVEKVARTGGHLASNLGVVELSIALHRALNSPEDKILWDVGHQAYVHKILTGRAEAFDTLRQTGGLSGFPKGKESPHDVYDTGHASNSLAAAAGIAAARDIRGEKYQVAAVIGDGSMTGGMAFEALNNIGARKSNVIVILNDNGMSIGRNTGSVSQYLGRLRVSRSYLETKADVKAALDRVPGVGHGLTRVIAETKDWVKYGLIGGGVMFEELGFTYLGPVDGHDMRALVTVLMQAKKARGPVLLHVITKKGKGYSIAENDPDKFHGIGAFDPETGDLRKTAAAPSWSSVFGKSLLEIGEEDNRVCAISAAMMDATGLTPFRERFPKRTFDVGIEEQFAVSFAAGLAKAGMRPVCAIYSSFLQRAYDQILEDVCLQNLPVIFAVDRAGIVGADGETHQGVFDISFLSEMPGMTVLTPATPEQLQQMLRYAFQLNGPCAIRYPRGEAACSELVEELVHLGESAEEPDPDSYGNLRLAAGKDGDIWAVGTMLEKAVMARAYLRAAGYDLGVVDVRTVKPLDLSLLQEGVTRIFTVEDGILTGGFGEQTAAAVPEGLHVTSFGWPDAFIEHGAPDDLYEMYGLDARSLAGRIRKELERTT